MSETNHAKHTCPVCGYPDLVEPHVDVIGEPTFAICPSCGTQFGADDLNTTHEALRETWLKSGAAWWSETQQAPSDWSAEKQVAAAFGESDG